MREQLLLLARVADIGVIIAARSLFPWEGDYESSEELTVKTSDADENCKEAFANGRDKPCLIGVITGDNIRLSRTHEALPKDLAVFLSAMGLGGKQAGASSRAELGEFDIEKLHDNVLTLDSAWCLLRRLGQFCADPSVKVESACRLLQFALKWSVLRTQINEAERNADGSLSKSKQTQVDKIGAEAADAPNWGIAGLTKIGLHPDPRGSALRIRFDGFSDMDLCAMPFDWVVGKVDESVSTVVASNPSRNEKFAVRPTRVKSNVLGVLNGLLIHQNSVTITQRLSKKLYDATKEVLMEIGGEWNTASQSFVFSESPTPRIDQIVQTGEIYTSKDYECFFTPATLAALAVQKADLRPGMSVLEPSAGHAVLALAAAEVVGKNMVTCYELMPRNVQHLKGLGFQIDGAVDFLSVKARPEFDVVMMNPPFSGGRDVAHITHALGFLKPGGKLVSFASTSWRDNDTSGSRAFKLKLAELGALVTDIPRGAFAKSGTEVPTTLISLRLPLHAGSNPQKVQAPAHKPVPTKAIEQFALF